MTILSPGYLAFSAASSVVTWMLQGKRRIWTVLVFNLLFLLLLQAKTVDLVYVLAVTVFSFLAARNMHAVSPKLSLFLSILPAVGLCACKCAVFVPGASPVLPLGISFYTFRAVSYLLEVRKGNLEAASFAKVFDYICFFPVFLAGPIHRPGAFFEELETPFVFSYTDQKNGFVQMMLGLFEKIVIADFLSRLTALFYGAALSGWYTVLGMIFYAFYIYADFDAYSNVAIGTARMLGFHPERNFHAPYCSASIMEFWRRWHISLSSWLRDYVYIPLGGSRKGTVRKYLNILIVFLVSGLWHGNTVLFLIWGLGHGILSVAENMIASFFRKKKHEGVKVLRPLLVAVNFLFVALLWVFFRCATVNEAVGILTRMTMIKTDFLIDVSQVGITINEWYWGLICLIMLVISDILRYRMNMLDVLSRQIMPVRWAFYLILLFTAMVFGVYGPGYHPEDFIYVTF